MSKREEYRQRLDELGEAWQSGTLQDGDDVYLLRTKCGFDKYDQECSNLKDLATEVLIEEAQTQSA